MSEGKYELLPGPITINGSIAYKIKALKSFGDVTAGQIGGAVSSESNCNHQRGQRQWFRMQYKI